MKKGGFFIMQRTSMFRGVLLLSVILLMTPVLGLAQNINASLSGVVSDATGGVIPGVELTLTSSNTGMQSFFITDDQGRYSFQNLTPGIYELRAVMTGFKEYVAGGIQLSINQKGRLNITLEVGAVSETIEVIGTPSQLNFENATREEGINPETLQTLPLLFNSGPRSSAGFAVLMPGVTTGGGNNAFDARINGGIQSGDEAVVDGVSMQQGTMSQSGMISIYQDFPFSPDMVSEIKVLTANYEPQYGGTSGATIIADTKSGTSEFHGSAFWYHRNSALNASAFDQDRPFQLQHNMGFNVGGPAKIPGAWGDKVKTYFYFNHEQWRINGGASSQRMSIPSMKNRQGDFSDWIDNVTGEMIPVYDPDTLRPNPSYNPGLDAGPDNLPFLRDPFPGNKIPQDRWSNSIALAYFKYLPTPTREGATLNYDAPPVPDIILANTKYYFWRIDTNIGDNDHIYWSSWSQWAPKNLNTALPVPISNEVYTDPQNSWVNRLNWTHTFSPTLINHFSIGYLNRNEGYGSINEDYIDEFPKIKGVAAHTHVPVINFGDGYVGYSTSNGLGPLNTTTRPTVVGNTLFTWVKGDHTIKWGAEYRDLGQNFQSNENNAGSFYFGSGPTGLAFAGKTGNSIASFLLEQVSSGNVAFRTVAAHYQRQKAIALYGGDTWKVTPQLTINYGLRWDVFTPAVEKYDRMSFFDPTLANPDAGGRLGALAFADEFNSRMGRRHPEETWYGGFAPRLGVAYALSDKTVIRTGYGIFFHQAYCPGWGGCGSLDGYNANPSFSATNNGMVPAFILSEGFPQDFDRPPFLEPGFRNGQGLMYRPFQSNKRASSHQWNLTIEHEVMKDMMVQVAYVGNKADNLPSAIAPPNVLNPNLLSMGDTLVKEYNGASVIDGVPIPYPGWAEQMSGCAPTVAQAMMPYPQYCSNIQGITENAGDSNYHSLQIKVDNSEGMFLLASYTWSKLITTTQQTNEPTSGTWSGHGAAISPFERERTYMLSNDDIPQVLSVSFIYELPGVGDGGIRYLTDGWAVTSIFRYSTGAPLYFRGGDNCSLPWQFRMNCIPNYSGDPYAQSKENFDPGIGPLFNKSVFEQVDFYEQGTGTPMTNERGFSYFNHDLSLIKNTRIGEVSNFQLRFEAFNLWNWHRFTSNGNWGDLAFNTNLGSADFGRWTGAVSAPRIIQVAARLEF